MTREPHIGDSIAVWDATRSKWYGAIVTGIVPGTDRIAAVAWETPLQVWEQYTVSRAGEKTPVTQSCWTFPEEVASFSNGLGTLRESVAGLTPDDAAYRILVYCAVFDQTILVHCLSNIFPSRTERALKDINRTLHTRTPTFKTHLWTGWRDFLQNTSTRHLIADLFVLEDPALSTSYDQYNAYLNGEIMPSIERSWLKEPAEPRLLLVGRVWSEKDVDAQS